MRYHDRYVDKNAGILYILMEYCGGGDLSALIARAEEQDGDITEDTIWDYFMQILLALNYCHHHDGKPKRRQILHRDLKPHNGTV